MSKITKDIEFKLKTDTEEFDRSISSMQRKLKDIYANPDMIRAQQGTNDRLSKLGFPGVAGATNASQDAYKRANEQSRKENEQLIREQIAGQSKLNEQIKARTQELQKLKKIQDEMIKGSAEEAAHKEKILRYEQQTNQAKQEYLEKDKALNQSIDSYKQNAPQGGKFMGMSTSGATLGGTMSLAATVATVVSAVTGFQRSMVNSPLVTSQSLGAANQAMFNPYVNDISSQNSVGLAAHQDQRAGSMLRARKRSDANQKLNIQDMVGGGLRDILGSFIGQESNGNGALLMGTAMTGIGKIPGLGSVGKMGDVKLNEYQAKQSELTGKDFASDLAAEQQKDPLRDVAADFLSKRAQADLSTQRDLGLDYNSFHGVNGYQSRFNKAGFGMDQAAAVSSQMLQAGGSTASAQDPMVALQAARGMDMTNAGTALGRLSASTGGESNSANNMLKKVLTSAVSQGLDESKYREEGRRYLDITSQILNRASTSNEGDAGTTLSKFNSFLGGNNTNKGLEGAQSAYEEFQSRTSATSGRFGAVQAASLISGGLSQGGGLGMAQLMEIPYEQITDENPAVQRIAVSKNISIEEAKKQIRDAKDKAQLAGMGINSKKRDSVASYFKNNGIMSYPTEKQQRAMPKNIREDFYQIGLQTEQSSNYTDPNKAKSAVMATLGIGGTMPDSATAKMNADLAKGPGNTGRQEDAVVSSNAILGDKLLENARQYRDIITPNTTAIANLTANLTGLIDLIAKSSDKDRAAVQQYVQDKMGQSVRNQPQAGKSKGK